MSIVFFVSNGNCGPIVVVNVVTEPSAEPTVHGKWKMRRNFAFLSVEVHSQKYGIRCNIYASAITLSPFRVCESEPLAGALTSNSAESSLIRERDKHDSPLESQISLKSELIDKLQIVFHIIQILVYFIYYLFIHSQCLNCCFHLKGFCCCFFLLQYFMLRLYEFTK